MSDNSSRRPIWIRCPDCDDYWCRLHKEHVYDCECPPLEEWRANPYTGEDGPVAVYERQRPHTRASHVELT